MKTSFTGFFIFVFIFSQGLTAQNKSIIPKVPVISVEPEGVPAVNNTRIPLLTENYVLVDSMQNAFSPAIAILNPLAYDPWADVAAVVHRGATSYGAGSGQLWYNISTDKGLTWTRVSSPINTNPIFARYPSMAISNPTHGSIAATRAAFSWPELSGSTWGGLGYGRDIPVGGGVPISGVITGPPTYSSQAPCWASYNNAYVFWVSDNSENAGLTLFRTTDFIIIEKINPPNWGSGAFSDGGNIAFGGASYNGVQYCALLGTLPDPNPTSPIISGWYPAYSKSTDNGSTWTNWNVADFRTISGLTDYDRLWDWKKNDVFVSYQGDLIVDNSGYVHMILGVTDTTTTDNSGNNAIIEIFETQAGWSGKVIAELGTISDSTNWIYSTLDQCGYSVFLSKSSDGSVLAAQWAMKSASTSLVDLYYSFRTIDGQWSPPINLTNTPNRTEAISHMSSYMVYNGNSSFTFFSMFAYDATDAIPPNDINITNIYIAPVSFYVIPVELISFTAAVVKGSVELKWHTATETNNQGFLIERRNNDDLTWQEIGFVDGAGTTTEGRNYSYIDKTIKTGIYYYHLKQIDFDGTFEYSSIIEVDINLPERFSIEQNYPNPFNPSTTISFELPLETQVELNVYDMLGNKIETLINKQMESGRYDISYDASDLSNGVYIYTIRAGNFVSSRKMVVLK